MGEKILYGEQTRKTLENMSFSGKQLSDYPEYIRAMAQVKWACARANERAGQLSQEKTERIGRACQEIVDGGHLEQFPVDVFHGGGGIGLNMNEVLAALAGGEVQPVDDINFCQSTSDVCHTSLRIALSSMTADLAKELDPYDAAQYPDDLTELSGQVRMCAAILSKFSRDLRLLSSGPETGLMELKFPALQAGSSFFPGKVNPVLPEMMIQCNML